MNPAKDRALQAAMARYARICRLSGNYNELPTEALHHVTQQLAVQQVLQRILQPARHITNTLNAVSAAILSP